MKQLNIIKIEAQPFAGSEIDKCKEEAKALATTFKCKVIFSHNRSEFLIDEEGNCVKTN